MEFTGSSRPRHGQAFTPLAAALRVGERSVARDRPWPDLRP
jgi:hypothetical protein